MRKLTVALTIALALAAVAGCKDESARAKNVQAQRSVMDRATASSPVPQLNNFLAREAVVKQVKRLDEAGKIFYVYIIGDNGQQLGYYVSSTRPMATCTLLTPPQEMTQSGNGNWAPVTAPGLGGTYSTASGCNSVFFFDAATDAYIEVSGMNLFIADQPLSVESEPIRIVNSAQ